MNTISFHSNGSIFSMLKPVFGSAGHFLVGIAGLLLLLLLVRTIVAWFVCRITADCLAALPPEHRKQQPAMVWLLMIPLFPYVWNYFVFPPVAKSFANYLAARGDKNVTDCGWGISLALCICSDATLLPSLGLIALLCELILLVVVLVNMVNLRSRVGTVQQVERPPAPPRNWTRAGLALMAAGFCGTAIVHFLRSSGILRPSAMQGPHSYVAYSLILSTGLMFYLLILMGLFLAPGRPAGRLGRVSRWLARVAAFVLIGNLLLRAGVLCAMASRAYLPGSAWPEELVHIYFGVANAAMVLFVALIFLTADMILAGWAAFPSVIRNPLLIVRMLALAILGLDIVVDGCYLFLHVSLFGLEVGGGLFLLTRMLALLTWVPVSCSLFLALICAAACLRGDRLTAENDKISGSPSVLLG